MAGSRGCRGFVDRVGRRQEELKTAAPTLADGRRIDFCFVSAGLAPLVRNAFVDSAATGSDHQPLFIEMDL